MGIRLLLLPLILCAAFSHAAPSPFDTLAPMDTLARRLARPAGFETGDFELLVNYRGALPKAPAAVASLLRDPRAADSLVPALRSALSQTFGNAHGILRAEGLWAWIGARPSLPARAPQDQSPESRTRAAEEGLRQYLRPLEPAQISFLLTETPGLLRHDAEDTLLNPIEREIERLREDAIADSVMRLAEALPMGKLAEAAGELDGLLAALLDLNRAQGPAALRARLQAMQRSGIPVTLGTTRSEVHRLDRGIVFDPGGDDRYVFPDTARAGSWLLVIDLKGDDVYASGDTATGGAAFLSLQVLADLGGKDRYLGGDFAFGSAVMGYSRLFDAAGNDAYTGRCASLGFAFRGLGILQDRAGNDAYSSAYLSQAASSSFGFAVLLDEAGDDHYVSRPEFVDDLRYREHFLSLSQGFSTGMAPKHGGGIAALWDRAGADSYVADIFGQGGGYWFGWGLLMDDAGNDSLRAHQYAQGAGVHFAVGMLLDASGDDARVSKGVSQGCGHDGGFGLLADAAGADHNTAVDMSAGAGSANGLGAFLDFAGADVYTMGNPAMTLGHGDMRRDRGSLGFFLDRGGKDIYPEPLLRARNAAAWRSYDGKNRGHGQGLDAE